MMIKGEHPTLPFGVIQIAPYTICNIFLPFSFSVIISGLYFSPGNQKHYSACWPEPYCTEHSSMNLITQCFHWNFRYSYCYDRRRSCPEEVGPVGSEPGPARRGTSQLDRTQANRATSGPAGAGPWHYRINRRFPPLGGGKRFACNDREDRGYHLVIACRQPLLF
jgi:hypothetical protein